MRFSRLQHDLKLANGVMIFRW